MSRFYGSVYLVILCKMRCSSRKCTVVSPSMHVLMTLFCAVQAVVFISFSTVKFCQQRQSLKCLISRIRYLFSGKLSVIEKYNHSVTSNSRLMYMKTLISFIWVLFLVRFCHALFRRNELIIMMAMRRRRGDIRRRNSSSRTVEPRSSY